MALPIEHSTWPPKGWANIRTRLSLHGAWYSGNPNRLAAVYGAILDNNLFPEAKHWARMARESRMTMVHMPIATDIAKVSASLLFGDHPQVTISEAEGDTPDATAVQTQDRLDVMIDEGGYYRTFHEAAESASAYGGVYLKVNWDKDLSDYPIISVVSADCAYGEFRFGVLSACTVVETLEEDGSTYLRLVERHEPGVILTALYKGTSSSLGGQIGLDSHDRTRGIENEVRTGLDRLAIVYIPNIRPNRDGLGYSDLWHGSSDYLGAETSMDALDGVYTNLIRDIELGQTRLFLPESMLELNTSTGKKQFRLDQEAYVAVGGLIENPQQELGNKIVQFQGAIRSEQLIASAVELVSRIVSTRGYSPSTFGIEVAGGAESGTALRTRHMKSIQTTAQKAEYWRRPLSELLESALVIDREKLGSGVVPYRPSVDMQDSIPTDFMQMTESVMRLRQAQSMSIEAAVEQVHPDWSDDAVTREVERIRDEQGMNLPLLPGEGG